MEKIPYGKYTKEFRMEQLRLRILYWGIRQNTFAFLSGNSYIRKVFY